MKNITLKDNEYELLMSILKDAQEERSNMGCNDPYESEKKLFTKDERIDMLKFIGNDDIDDFLYNFDYVYYIKKTIKSQIK